MCKRQDVTVTQPICIYSHIYIQLETAVVVMETAVVVMATYNLTVQDMDVARDVFPCFSTVKTRKVLFFSPMRFGTFVLSLSSRNRKDNVGVKFTNLPGEVLFDLDQSSQNPPSSKNASVYWRRKTGRCERRRRRNDLGSF